MSLTPLEVVRYIQKNEEENHLAECMYFGAINGLSNPRNDLSRLDDVLHVERILSPFLKQWGNMARTLGRKGTRWAQLGARLRKLEPHFKEFRGKSFLQIHFEDEKTSVRIKEIYEELRDIKYFGPTAVSKILHLMNNEIFVMWDGKILNMYNVASSSKGYVEFLALNKRLLETVFNDQERIDLRSKFHNKTLAKLIDEFNWYVANEDRTPQISAIYRKV